MEYSNDIFTDCSFYKTPKFSYDVFINRTYVNEINTVCNTFCSKK